MKKVVSLLEGFVITYVTSVLLGAPVLSFKETGFFSLLMSLLIVTPRFTLQHDTKKSVLESLISLRSLDFEYDKIEQMVRTISWFCIAGAWASAVVIPLDWDRPWQKWPIPCCVGAVGGFLLGLTYVKLRKF